MAKEHVYKILFILQSAAFTIFIINYSQSPTSTVHKAQSHFECKPNDTRQVFVTAKPPVGKTEEVQQGVPFSQVTAKIDTVAKSDEGAPTVFRGPVSNCSLADVKKRPGVVMLTTANLAYVDVVLNMLESVKRLGVCINTTVIAEDQKAYNLLLKYAKGDPAVHVQLTNSGEMDVTEHARTDRSQYYGIMNKRQAYMLAFLEQGLEVLFSDSDTYWFRDPFPHFQGDFDMSLRAFTPTRIISKTSFCAGFIYMKPTKATVLFVKGWVDALEGHRKRGSYPADQNVMNGLLTTDKPVHVDIKLLEPNLFPWGPTFFDPKWQKEKHPTVVMHAASIRGHPAKLAKFKALGMWHVNETELTL